MGHSNYSKKASSRNIGEFLAFSGLVHLLHNVEELEYKGQPLGKGFARVST
jgi:hypothetical protein